MTTDSFNRRLKKYCKEAGVPYHSSHKIRFYNASTAFDGNNLTTLSYLMGHSETATTLHYLRNVNKRKNDRLAFSESWYFIIKCSKVFYSLNKKKKIM